LRLVYAPAALDDLDRIEEYIVESSLENAICVGDSLRACCGRIAGIPQLGPARDELVEGLRYFPHTDSNYQVFYRVRGEVMEIARILHGSLDYAKLFLT
jgi:toxin ParE1/3/4